MARKKTEVPTLDIFGVTNLSKYFRVSRGWVYAHLTEIPHRRVGDKIIFLKRAIDEWIANSQRGSTAGVDANSDIIERECEKLLGRP